MCMCALECVCVCARSRYDGWDNMNRMDIREKFQQMTPEKIKFAKKGFTEVIWLLDFVLDFVIINVLFCCVL